MHTTIPTSPIPTLVTAADLARRTGCGWKTVADKIRTEAPDAILRYGQRRPIPLYRIDRFPNLGGAAASAN